MKTIAASFPKTFFRRSRLTALPVAALSLALTGLASTLSAATCSYGEIFDFTSTSGGTATQVGTMPKLDIDREAVSVTVTNTGGGNLPAGVFGGATSFFTANTDEFFFPGHPATAAPTSYGHMLRLAGGDETPMTFTFTKTMRNLTMNIMGGDNKIFSFTDGDGVPLAFTLRGVAGSSGGGFAKALSDPPTSGNGANSFYVKQLSSTSIAVGEFGYATIAFDRPVSVVKMTQTYARATLGTGATFNTTGSTAFINFGQYCDQAGVTDTCLAPHPATWISSNTGTQRADGRIVDETGKVITVQYQGGLTGISQYSGSSGTEEGTFLFPIRPTMDVVSAQVTNTAASPAVLTWVFGEPVRNPLLLLRANTVAAATTLKFYKADGVTPLSFVLRNPAHSAWNRQLDKNELYAIPGGSFGSMIQFVEETSAIVMKVSGGDNPFGYMMTVILNCNGTLTPSGSTIDADSDGDGVPDLTDKCANTPAGAVVGSDGYPLPTDLSIVKTASVSKITPGVPFTYTVTVTNTGAQATNVKASDLVPAGLTINSTSASDGGVVTQNGQAVQAVWSIVPNGGTRTLTINVTKP